jgi:hypothetical protein
MTEMAFELGWIINDKRELRRIDTGELSHALRRMVSNRGEYVRPIELVEQRLNARA